MAIPPIAHGRYPDRNLWNMNSLGVHSFVWTAGASDADAERAIGLTAKAGFDLMEIAAMDLAAIDIAFARRTLERHQIGATMSFGLDADHDVSSNDNARAEAGRQRLLDGITVARTVEVVRHVGKVAAQSGITLGMEFVNRYESNILNSAAQAVDFVHRVDFSDVPVHFDCDHMNIEEADVAEAIRATENYLGSFHTRDSRRGCLGSGSIDISRIFRSLVAIDYGDPITFESFSSRVVEQRLEGTRDIWRNLWEDGWDLAVDGRTYTLAQLKAPREAANTVARSRLP